MKYSFLGRTGIEVSEICFGSLTISPWQKDFSPEQAGELLEYAFSRGINFIDTAKLYENYGLIREGLKRCNREVVVATKSYDYEAAGLRSSLEAARKGLDRDIIDIFMLHEQESSLTFAGHREAWEEILKAKSEGRIRAAGISTHHVAAVEMAAEVDEIEVIHPIINYRGTGIQDGTAAEMIEAVRKAAAAGKGIYGMKILGGGNLIGDAAHAIRWACNLGILDSIALGMQSEEEIDVNIALVEGREPEAEKAAKLRSRERRLIVDSYCRGCGRCVEQCPADAMRIIDGKAVPDMDRCLFCGYCAAVCPEFAIKVI